MGKRNARFVKGSAAAKAYMKRIRGMVGKGGGGKAKTKTRVVYRKSPSKSGGSRRKGLTVGKILDMFAIGGPAAHRGIKYAVNRNIYDIKFGILKDYTGLDLSTNTFEAGRLVRGYGGAVSRVIERKIFRMIGIRGPRMKMKNVGDLLDHATYWGKTAIDVFENRANPVEASRTAYKTQFGINLEVEGLDGIQPNDMIMYKLGPYIGQKIIRKVLRHAGIKLPSFGMGG